MSEKRGPLAQLVEPPAHNRLVVGSNPAGATKLCGLVAQPGRASHWQCEGRGFKSLQVHQK